MSILTFTNSGALSFSSDTITVMGTVTKLSLSDSSAFILSFIDTKKDNVSWDWNLIIFLIPKKLKFIRIIKSPLGPKILLSLLHQS